MRELNKHLVWDFDGTNSYHVKALGIEMTVTCLLNALLAAKSKMLVSSDVSSMPESLLLVLYVVRTAGARLIDVAPDCSHDLSRVSMQLGSIIVDAAILTGAKFDLGRSNAEASILLDKIKLTTDSKLRKQYPNLEVSELCCRCY